MNGCEWNPTDDRPAVVGDEHTETVPAVVSVGASRENNWHLCDACAGLPRFERLRRRVRLARDGGEA